MKRLLFVDDEPRILQGLQRQFRGERHEWDMHFFDAAPKALEFMADNPPDVVVTDMIMPVMDGAQLLTEVSQRHPNTVRIVLSGHADRESVLRLVGPAHQYLSKPCDSEELRHAITRAFALRDLLSSDQLKRLASRLGSLPSLPSLHLELTEEMRKEEPSIERIGEIMSKDMGMTAKILQLVNSAFFGLARSISNPTEAVNYLGLATVRALVMSLQVFSQFEQKKVKDFSIESLAQHCWTTGAFARRIAEKAQSDPKTNDQCLLAGMLHDVGRLILAVGLPDNYERVLNTAREQHTTIWQVELAEFGATHAEVGAYLLGLWGLPNPVIEAVAFHHRPADCPSRGFSPLIAVHVANAFAHDQSGTHEDQPGNQIDEACLEAAGLSGKIDSWRDRCFDDGL